MSRALEARSILLSMIEQTDTAWREAYDRGPGWVSEDRYQCTEDTPRTQIASTTVPIREQVHPKFPWVWDEPALVTRHISGRTRHPPPKDKVGTLAGALARPTTRFTPPWSFPWNPQPEKAPQAALPKALLSVPGWAPQGTYLSAFAPSVGAILAAYPARVFGQAATIVPTVGHRPRLAPAPARRTAPTWPIRLALAYDPVQVRCLLPHILSSVILSMTPTGLMSHMLDEENEKARSIVPASGPIVGGPLAGVDSMAFRSLVEAYGSPPVEPGATVIFFGSDGADRPTSAAPRSLSVRRLPVWAEWSTLASTPRGSYSERVGDGARHLYVVGPGTMFRAPDAASAMVCALLRCRDIAIIADSLRPGLTAWHQLFVESLWIARSSWIRLVLTLLLGIASGDRPDRDSVYTKVANHFWRCLVAQDVDPDVAATLLSLPRDIVGLPFCRSRLTFSLDAPASKEDVITSLIAHLGLTIDFTGE